MRVTLKKAAGLAAALASVSVLVNTSVNVSIFSDRKVQDVIDEEMAVLSTNLDRALSLVEAVYTIRDLIGKANEGTISELLTERARIDKQLAVLNPLLQPNARKLDTDAVERQLQSMREKGGESSGFGSRTADTVTVPLPTSPRVESHIKALKKARIRIEDRLAEFNFKTTIELPEEVVKLLTELDLI